LTMSIRKIITPENRVLRRKARRVAQITPEIQVLIDDMIETMREAPGLGLAAPQVGQGLCLFVAEYADQPEPAGEDAAGESVNEAEKVPPKLYVLINPEIVRASAEMAEGTEGCLSIPGYAGTVERHEAVTVKALNRKGSPIKIKAKGWLARIFQHEVDHLEGVLYIDRASRVWRIEEGEEAQTDPV